MVWLEITHSVLSLRTEKNFDIDTRIETLKTRLYSIVGTSPSHMQLQLFSVDGQLVHGDMPDDSTLGQCGCTMDHMRVHVIDNDPTSSLSQLNNVESVQKYVISEEDYDKRDDTFRKWKERNLGSAELEQQQQGEQQQLQKQTEEQQLHAELIKNIKAGDRCQLNNELSARGTVRYVGKAAFGTGYWVGVQLDEPVGKHNGTVKGNKYFECMDKHGVFVRPDKLSVGDYPEEDFDFGSDDEI